MPQRAITRSDDGERIVPRGRSDWGAWVSASATRNHVIDDPLLDWLERYGELKGFERDELDARTDRGEFVMAKGRDFEDAVVEHLRDLGVGRIVTVGASRLWRRPSRSLFLAHRTWRAMNSGVEIICQGVLRDPEHRTHGVADLLVRSDVLARLFPDSLTADEAAIPAGDLSIGGCHYRVVDIKFTTLRLSAAGGLLNSGSNPAYKVQLYIYNRALGRIQGYLPPEAFVLGRGWTQTINNQQHRGGSCMDRLAAVGHDETLRGVALGDHAQRAVCWLRRLRLDGNLWDALPEPTVEELRPNAKQDAGAWSGAVKQIAEQTEDLTVLWNVSAAKRRTANAKGLTSWRETDVTPEALGITADKQSTTLGAMLAVNRSLPPNPRAAVDPSAVQPPVVTAAVDEWGTEPPLEFFVDYETVNDLDDDFTKIPRKGGQPLIFMIGCGHIEHGNWRFECFIADELTVSSEAAVIEGWLDHMAAVRDRVAPGVDPAVIHWSAHERSSLQTAYNAATSRHPDANWASPRWFDLLNKVVRAQPVVVRGAHGFGLKAMTNAMHRAGLINTQWGDGPADGQAAMVAAWSCQRQLRDGRAQRLADLELMQQVRDYNETDCRAMCEVLQHLRNHHRP